MATAMLPGTGEITIIVAETRIGIAVTTPITGELMNRATGDDSRITTIVAITLTSRLTMVSRHMPTAIVTQRHQGADSFGCKTKKARINTQWCLSGLPSDLVIQSSKSATSAR